MGRALKIGAIALLVIAALVGLAAWGLSQKDSPETFLEDDPAIRAAPNYPVKISDVSALSDQVVIERDVWITTRDGTRLSANIFRPTAPGKHPVVMAFTAYNKNKGPENYPKLLRHSLKPDFDLGTLPVSPWTSWEGPDPAFWVPKGYAVIYVDSRGFASSEGSPSTLSRRDRDDFYDAIEWAGAQDWSNGNVGLNGVSYLAISQWVAASGNPPSLKAIIPWEGQSDPFREVIYHGGIAEVNFTNFWIRKMRSGANGNPLPHPILFEFAQQRPALLRWFQTRPNTISGIDLPRITVPALIAATWSDHGLHTRGRSRDTSGSRPSRSGSTPMAAASGMSITATKRWRFSKTSSTTFSRAKTMGLMSVPRSGSKFAKRSKTTLCAMPTTGRFPAPSTVRCSSIRMNRNCSKALRRRLERSTMTLCQAGPSSILPLRKTPKSRET